MGCGASTPAPAADAGAAPGPQTTPMEPVKAAKPVPAATAPAATTPAAAAPEAATAPVEPPTVWIASSGLPSDELRVAFLQTLLKRRGVFDASDVSLDLTQLKLKYKEAIESLKMVHIMDALFFRNYDTIREWKDLGGDGGGIFSWDIGVIRDCGFKPENVTLVCLNMKPWLFTHAGEPGMWSEQKPPSVATAEEETEYMSKLQQCRDAYAALKADPPECVPATASGKSVADELAAVSQGLNKKYPQALSDWCESVLAGADVVSCQGGDVVNMNMTFQCNQMLASHLIKMVRANKTLYAGHSAGAMCMAKSMEMTHEIGPGWLEAFACSKEFLKSDGVMFDEKDLNGDGVNASVLGALPMFESPFAMRPHYKEGWMDDVLAKNKAAEAEFEKETGKEIDDSVVDDSAGGADAALRLLNIVGQNAKEQDAPVFLPLRDGRVIVGQFAPDGKESFHAIGTASTKAASTLG